MPIFHIGSTVLLSKQCHPHALSRSSLFPLGVNMAMSILGKKQFKCEHDDATGSKNGIVDGSRYCLLLNDD